MFHVNITCKSWFTITLSFNADILTEYRGERKEERKCKEYFCLYIIAYSKSFYSFYSIGIAALKE